MAELLSDAKLGHQVDHFRSASDATNHLELKSSAQLACSFLLLLTLSSLAHENLIILIKN